VENISGIFMWLNRDGMGGFDSSTRPDTEIWVRHSISAQHNLHWKGDPAYLFSELVNSSAVFESLAYTSIIATGPRSAAITYSARFSTGNFHPGSAIGFRAVAPLEARPDMRVTNSMPLGSPLLLTVATINCIETLKVQQVLARGGRSKRCREQGMAWAFREFRDSGCCVTKQDVHKREWLSSI
jgi:hypothetical protein